MNPGPSHFGQRTIRQNRGVFERNAALIIEPIGNPAAHRFRREPAFVHRDMERMLVVISRFTNFAQFLDKSLAIPKSGGHKTISNPSQAISILARSSSPRSREPGMRIGLVLFMWVYIFRRAGEWRKKSRLPSAIGK